MDLWHTARGFHGWCGRDTNGRLPPTATVPSIPTVLSAGRSTRWYPKILGKSRSYPYPIASRYGILWYISLHLVDLYSKNAGKYSIHGFYGYGLTFYETIFGVNFLNFCYTKPLFKENMKWQQCTRKKVDGDRPLDYIALYKGHLLTHLWGNWPLCTFLR